MIRTARRRDIDAMLAIYAPFVEDSAVSFEYEVPSRDEFEARFERIARKYPWLVYESEGRVLGYAYADEALSRAAYQWCADMAIYLAPEARHTGAGHALYGCLERRMEELGYRRLYALVTSSNLDSCRFHERRGYELQGVLRRAGWKLGAWHDVNWYALMLDGDEPPRGVPERPEPDT